MMNDERSADRLNSSFIVCRSSFQSEWEPAFRLIFGTSPGERQTAQVANAIGMLRKGELHSDGLIVAHRNGALAGAMMATPMAGAAGLVWPPHVLLAGDRGAVEDKLVTYASSWLGGLGTKLAQALLPPSDAEQAAPLLRNGFAHITELRYMRHDLFSREREASAGSRGRLRSPLNYQTYEQCNQADFHEILRRTYQDTLDCPEVNHVREVEEVIAGHMAQGKHDPSRWWLALKDDRPIGVLLLAEFLDSPNWDLAYLGVLPEARRQGYGRELAVKAIQEARNSHAFELTLAVDARNEPALRLYRSLGFTETDRRNVYLAIWS